MKYYLSFVLICSSLTLFAQDSTITPGHPGPGILGGQGGYIGQGYPGMGPGYGVKYDPCIANLNMAVNGFGFMNGQSPIKIDDSGKLAIDHKKIKSFKQNGNIKTIIYNSTNPYGVGETVHKIDVTEEKGKIVHVTRYEDVAGFKKWQKDMNSNGGTMSIPMLTKTDESFEHQGTGCQMTSSEATMEKDGKTEIKVTHDKKLCDDIAPLMNQMGRQNAMQCAGLFSQIEESYKSRNKEFAKQGKELAVAMGMGMGGMNGMSTDADFGSKARDWTMMSVISNCMMTDNAIFPGMGLGMGMGYPGVGTNGGYPAGIGASFDLGGAVMR